MDRMDKLHVRQERWQSIITSTHSSHSQRYENKPWKNVAYRLTLYSLRSLLFHTHQGHLPRDGIITMGWACLEPNHTEPFSHLRFFSDITSLCQVDREVASTLLFAVEHLHTPFCRHHALQVPLRNNGFLLGISHAGHMTLTSLPASG